MHAQHSRAAVEEAARSQPASLQRRTVEFLGASVINIAPAMLQPEVGRGEGDA